MSGIIAKRHLLHASPENVKRLARWLGLRNTDNMSHRQVCSLVWWLMTRREKRSRGLTWEHV